MSNPPISTEQLAELQQASSRPIPDDQGSTRDDAIARAERIRAGIRSLAELQQDITDAFHAKDWETLGYDSWDAYVSGEFGQTMPRMDRSERQELVVNLRAEGLSTRAIASATGTSKSQVDRDLPPVPNGTPEDRETEPGPVTGLDGKQYQPKTTAAGDESADTAEEDEQQESVVPTKRKQAPRTDVVTTINRVLARANEAADAADKITAEHLKDRAGEVSAWNRHLARHVQSLTRLQNLMEEHN